MTVYLVAEGASDVRVLKKLLDREDVKDVHVVAAGGKSAVVSFAKSLLLAKRKPVAAVMDADTSNGENIAEQEIVAFDLIRPASKNTPFRVFFAVPTLENALRRHQSSVQQGQPLDNLTTLYFSPDVTSASDATQVDVVQELLTFLRGPKSWRPTSEGASEVRLRK